MNPLEWVSRSGHDYCSPSSLLLRAACPGSARLLRDVERFESLDKRGSIDASRGVLLHHLTMGFLIDEVDIEAFTMLPEEDKQQVKWCVARTKEIIGRFKGQKHVVIYEEQIDLSELGISGGKHGCRIDALILVPGYGAVVIDWKFGRGWVTPPEFNLQTRTYGWGVHHNYGGMVETIILQPQSPEGRDYMVYTIHEDDFDEIAEQIKGIVQQAKDPNAPLVRGEHCKGLFCVLRGDACPLWNKSLLEIPDNKSISSYFKALSPAKRKTLYEHLQAISHVARCCEQKITALCIEDGIEMEGYEVVDGKASYHCDDTKAIIDNFMPFAKQIGLNQEDLLTPIIPAQAKNKSDYIKLFGNKTTIRDALDKVFTKVVSGKRLKRQKE